MAMSDLIAAVSETGQLSAERVNWTNDLDAGDLLIVLDNQKGRLVVDVDQAEARPLNPMGLVAWVAVGDHKQGEAATESYLEGLWRVHSNDAEEVPVIIRNSRDGIEIIPVDTPRHRLARTFGYHVVAKVLQPIKTTPQPARS